MNHEPCILIQYIYIAPTILIYHQKSSIPPPITHWTIHCHPILVLPIDSDRQFDINDDINILLLLLLLSIDCSYYPT